MEYKFTQNENNEDFACGRVIYHMGGEPTFPVRLALEMYERCLQYSNKKENITLYDCCCGGAYMLTVLGLLKNDTISGIYGSDIDANSLKLAADNLGLLTEAGIQKRRDELETLHRNYGKESHKEALLSLSRIEKLLPKEMKISVFHRNALEVSDLPFIPDIIITDVPYGNLVEWGEGSGGINHMMDALSGICGRETILCVCMDKKQKIQTERYQRLERQLIGKRKFEIYKKKIYGTLTCAKEYAEQDKLGEWVQLFLRGDGNNIILADGLKENNFKYVSLQSMELDQLDVPVGIPDYLAASNDKEWFCVVISEMISSKEKGWDMPPIIVHLYNGDYHPCDGRHRIEALRKMGIAQVMAVIVVNTEEDYKALIQNS
jgi:hypothetical protein